MPQTAIIILNWNQPKLTQQTLNSLLKLKTTPFHIFLLDNGSTDNSFVQFKKKYGKHQQITLLHSPKNLGFAAGNNLVAQKLLSKFSHLLFCNNDIKADPKFLNQLLTAAAKNPTTALIGPKIYFAPGFEFHQNRYTKSQQGKVIWSAGGHMDWGNVIGSNIGVDQVDRGQFNRPNFQVDFLTGCCLLAKTSVLKKIGLFDPKYFMYLEDADLCLRAKQAGFKILYWPQAKIWHFNSGSSAAGSHLQDYFISRNRLYFGHKFAPLRARLALFRQGLTFLFGPNQWKRQAFIDYLFGRMGRGSWQ